MYCSQTIISTTTCFDLTWTSSGTSVLNVLLSVLETGTACHINANADSEESNNLRWWIQWVGFIDYKTQITGTRVVLRQSQSVLLHTHKTGPVTQIPTRSGAGHTTFQTNVRITAISLQRQSNVKTERRYMWVPHTESFITLSSPKELLPSYNAMDP